jgi:hypothetical protein
VDFKTHRVELRQQINALFGGEVRKVSQTQEYLNCIFFLKWGLNMKHWVQSGKTFSKFFATPVIPKSLVPITQTLLGAITPLSKLLIPASFHRCVCPHL